MEIKIALLIMLVGAIMMMVHHDDALNSKLQRQKQRHPGHRHGGRR